MWTRVECARGWPSNAGAVLILPTQLTQHQARDKSHDRDDPIRETSPAVPMAPRLETWSGRSRTGKYD